uniref:Uncharacterized protein n=1 Tax=Zea mays TaxID=4577 RepID=C0PPC7_MAIZE|nr:unknown [Zea mays]
MVLSAEPVQSRSLATQRHSTAASCALTSHARVQRAAVLPPRRSQAATWPSEPAA